MKCRIYLSSPHMGGQELKYINEAFDSNWIAPLGPGVDAFEQELCRITGAKYATALVSGTSAIHLALILSGVGAGDMVLCQSFTFSASANPIIYQGAKPVFIGSEPYTWNMDPEKLEEAILKIKANGHDPQLSTGFPGIKLENITGDRSAPHYDNKLPKAIIAVHLYGMPAYMDEIKTVAEKYNIPVIEDAAEALGSEYKGVSAGAMGKFGIISFNGNKIITTSGGGALLSNDRDLIKKARFLATQARDEAPHYQHSQIGYNYRMSNVVASIGRGQLEVLGERVAQRRNINRYYRELLDGVPGVKFQTEPNHDHFSNYWLTTIIIDPQKAPTTRDRLIKAFAAENIESRPLWKPLHLQPVFAPYKYFGSHIEEKLFDTGLCLPSGSNLSDEDLGRISMVLMKEFGITPIHADSRADRIGLWR